MSYDKEQQRMKFTVTGKVSGSTATARLTVEAETFGEAEAIAIDKGLDVESIEPVEVAVGGEPMIVDLKDPLTNTLDRGADAPATPKARANTDGDRTSPDNRAAIFAIALGAVGILISFMYLASRGNGDDYQPAQLQNTSQGGGTAIPRSALQNLKATAQHIDYPVRNFRVYLDNNSEYFIKAIGVSVSGLDSSGAILWTEKHTASMGGDIDNLIGALEHGGAYPGTQSTWTLDRSVPLTSGQQMKWHITHATGRKVR